MKSVLTSALLISISLLSNVTQACSYLSTSSFKCNGVRCTYDYECESNYCDRNGYCKSYTSQPWVIIMIVFFSLFFFFSIVGGICRKRRLERQ